jgi:hypothetical protein
VLISSISFISSVSSEMKPPDIGPKGSAKLSRRVVNVAACTFALSFSDPSPVSKLIFGKSTSSLCVGESESNKSFSLQFGFFGVIKRGLNL